LANVPQEPFQKVHQNKLIDGPKNVGKLHLTIEDSLPKRNAKRWKNAEAADSLKQDGAIGVRL
jgi:hypothetical protein